MRICIIGAGRMAKSLLHSMSDQVDLEIYLYSRTFRIVKDLQSTFDINPVDKLSSIPKNCDVYALAVPDRAISDVTCSLEQFLDPEKLVVHHSGGQSIDVINPYFHNRAVVWPVMSLEVAGTDLLEVPLIYDFIFASENKDLIQIFHEFIDALGNNSALLSEEQRKTLHLSAVMSNNFITHLMRSCRDLLQERGVKSDLLLPILLETISREKYLNAENYQTGPAARNDVNTILQHIEQLEGNRLQEIYRVISESIMNSERIDENN